MDPLSVLVGAALAAVGMALGIIRTALHKAKPTPIVDTCGCIHPLAFHNRETDACSGEIRRQLYDGHGNKRGYTWVKCTCQRYTGPPALEDFVPRD